MERRYELDQLDRKILICLQENGRMGFSELGRKIGLSQPAVSERVRRLEEKGAIQGYSARVDPAALGMGMLAIIRLKTTHEHIRTCLQRFREIPYVLEVSRVTGEDCFVLKVAVPAAGKLEDIVDTLARYGAVTTAIVLRSEIPKAIPDGMAAEIWQAAHAG